MKRILTFLLLFAAIKVAGQTTGYLRFDTVRIMKQNGTCELYIINKTKDSLGLLTNVGGGLTQFRRSRMLNDSTLIIGLDTLTVHGTGGGSGTVTSASNVGTGEGWFKDLNGTDLRFKSFIGTNSLSLTANTNDITAQLVNDQSTPGNKYVYGTNSSGTKGWQPSDTLVVDKHGTGEAIAFYTTDTIHTKSLGCSGCTWSTQSDSSLLLTVSAGSSTLAALTDVNISSPANLQLLQYQTSDNKWHNFTPNFWKLGGNATGGATEKFGTTDNNHIEFIANNTVVGAINTTVQGFVWGGTATSIISGYGFNVKKRAIFATTPTGQNEVAIDDDGANNQNATFVVNPSGSGSRSILVTAVNAAAFTARPYGTTTDGYVIGGRNSVDANAGYFGMKNSVDVANTSGQFFTLKATNNFAPTSGTGEHYVVWANRTINQTGGANGATGAILIDETLTAAAGYFAIKNTRGDNLFNTSAGNTGIGISSGPTARLHLAASTTGAASLRVPTGTAPTSPNEGDIWSASNFPKYYNGSATRRFALTNDASPSNGQIPIGNGTDYTVANITSSGGTVTVTNGAGTINLEIPATTSSSGNYTATLTNGTNVASSSFISAHYYRTGSHVTVYIKISVDPTGLGATDLGISLPIASNFNASGQLIGLGNCTSIPDQTSTLDSDTTNDRANFVYNATDTNSQVFYITFSYEIL